MLLVTNWSQAASLNLPDRLSQGFQVPAHNQQDLTPVVAPGLPGSRACSSHLSQRISCGPPCPAKYMDNINQGRYFQKVGIYKGVNHTITSRITYLI